MHQLEQARRNNFSPRDKRGTAEWAKGIKLPPAYAFKGEFDVAISPWLIRPFRAMDDMRVRETTIRAAVRGGKTLIGDIWLAKQFVTNPMNAMFNVGIDDDAKDHANLRFIPLLKAIPAVKKLIGDDPSSVTNKLVKFKNGTYVIIQGLCNPGNFDAKGVCYLINDEGHKAPPGNIKKAYSRTDDFRPKAKVLNISQGGVPHDDMDVLFEKGTREYFGWVCPACGLHQKFRWRNDRGQFNLRYDRDEVTCPNGNFDLDKLAKTIRYHCENEDCKFLVRDNPAERRQMTYEMSDYLPPENPLAPVASVSCHWNQLPVPWVPWREIVEDWIAANVAFDLGDSSKLKEFFQRRMGENWDETEARPYQAEEQVPTGFMAGDKWDEEINRFMTCDVQASGGRHFISVARAFSKTGKSRVMWAGRIDTYEQIEEKRLELGIHPACVALDCAHEPDEVLPMCAKYGWLALCGSDNLQWPHPSDKGTEYKPWSKPIKCVMGMGTKAQGKTAPAWKFFWSNPYFKEMQFRRINGKKIEYLAPDNIGEISTYVDNQSGKPTSYWEQMRAESRRPRKTKTGTEEIEFVRIGKRPNHMLDCERMILVLAGLANLLGFDIQ